MKPAGSGLFFFERFLITYSVSLLVIALFYRIGFLVLYDPVLIAFVFLGFAHFI